MASWFKLTQGVRTVLTLLLLAGIGYLLYRLQVVLLYLIASAILAFIGSPLCSALKRIRFRNKKFPDALAALVVIAVQLGVFAALILLLVPGLLRELSRLGQVDYVHLWNYAQEQIKTVQTLSQRYHLEIDPNDLRNLAMNYFNFNDIGKLLSGLGSWVGGFSAALFSILFITFFFLKEEGLARNMLFSLFKEEESEKLQRITTKTKNLLSRYFIGLLIQISINALLIGVGLKLVGFREVLFVAVFAGMLNIVPYVGPLLGAVVGLGVALLQNLDQDFATQVFPLLVRTAVVFTAAQMLDNMLFQPLIFSNSVQAHPLEIFLVILAAGSLGGLLSMVVAVPLYSFARIVAKEFLSEVRIVQKLTEDV